MRSDPLLAVGEDLLVEAGLLDRGRVVGSRDRRAGQDLGAVETEQSGGARDRSSETHLVGERVAGVLTREDDEEVDPVGPHGLGQGFEDAPFSERPRGRGSP